MTVTVAHVGELHPGETKKFVFQCNGLELEGFVLNWAGQHHAYVNRCRHVPMSLDWDGRFVQCATHGAYYEPETGACVAGPPCGRTLYRIPLRVEGDTIVAECPGEILDD